MIMNIRSLFRRDLKKTMNLRSLVIWIALAGMGVFFFYASGGKTKLVDNDKIEFISLFLPHMIFGSWAVLSSYFDLVSSDREHNVLDCTICSGIPKTRIFISKVLVAAVMSLVFSLIYMTPVTFAIIRLSGNFTHILVLIQYLLPLWGYIMVYAAMGMLISVIARSSKAALIWSLAIGLLLMPRLFVMIVEGIGKVFGWTTQMIENFSMIAPGVMMQGLSAVSDLSRFSLAAVIFGISIILFLTIAYLIFIKQDEYNYGE
ncbi:MAG: ABC transporter permease subunit [Clostridiales bacterium]|nr:ABC transporter permease subunit [Clostridiales bacterium]